MSQDVKKQSCKKIVTFNNTTQVIIFVLSKVENKTDVKYNGELKIDSLDKNLTKNIEDSSKNNYDFHITLKMLQDKITYLGIIDMKYNYDMHSIHIYNIIESISDICGYFVSELLDLHSNKNNVVVLQNKCCLSTVFITEVQHIFNCIVQQLEIPTSYTINNNNNFENDMNKILKHIRILKKINAKHIFFKDCF